MLLQDLTHGNFQNLFRGTPRQYAVLGGMSHLAKSLKRKALNLPISPPEYHFHGLLKSVP